jgi:serine protease Do
MPSDGQRRRLVVLLSILGALLVVAFHQSIVGGIAYAVERGKIQANSEELSKVEALSNVFRMVAKTVRPSVVRIVTTGPSRRGMRIEDLPEPLQELFRFHGGGALPQPRPERGTGSGVVIDAEKGYVLTNNHVVAKAERIDVHLADGRHVEGKLLGADDGTDLALVQIKADKLHAAEIGNSDEMEVGDWVLAVGAPFGLEQTVSQGIISAKGRSNVGILDYEDFIQTDAAINPGNSGGPLVNMRGEVIGINTAIATNPVVAGYMGVGFAIPSNMAQEILPKLIEGKKIVRGYLGVRIQSLRDQPGLGKVYGLEDDTGVLIGELLEGGPAAKSGLKADDVILEYNGKPVADSTELQSMVAATDPGTSVPMKVWRDGKAITVDVTIGKQPEGFSTRGWMPGWAHGEGGQEGPVEVKSLGVTVASITEEVAKKYGWPEDEVKDLEGVIVTEVDPYGEAASLRIRPGEIITSVQRKPVKSPSQFADAITKEALAEGIAMRVKGRDGTRVVFVQVAE